MNNKVRVVTINLSAKTFVPFRISKSRHIYDKYR